MTNGVLYCAIGTEYLDLATASARSLREHDPDLPCDLFTDIPGAADTDVFDVIRPVPEAHPRAKLDCMPLTRFAHTLYLDADTMVVQSLGDLFDLLLRFDMALAHDVRRASPLIQQGLTERTPYAFPQLNSGVVLYRRTPGVIGFMREWARRFRAAQVSRDQIILKDMLWTTDLRFYVLPPEFNLRRVTMLDAWEPMDARPTILHSHRFKDHLAEGKAARIETFDALIREERIAASAEWERMEALPDNQIWWSGLRGGGLDPLSARIGEPGADLDPTDS